MIRFRRFQLGVDLEKTKLSFYKSTKKTPTAKKQFIDELDI